MSQSLSCRAETDFKAKMRSILLFQNLKCENLLPLLVLHYSKLNIFGFGAAGQTKQAILRHHLAPWGHFFTIFWHQASIRLTVFVINGVDSLNVAYKQKVFYSQLSSFGKLSVHIYSKLFKTKEEEYLIVLGLKMDKCTACPWMTGKGHETKEESGEQETWILTVIVFFMSGVLQ